MTDVLLSFTKLNVVTSLEICRLLIIVVQVYWVMNFISILRSFFKGGTFHSQLFEGLYPVTD